MHPDTYRLLKFSTDQVRGMLTKDEDYDLTWLSGLAQAENLLAAHNAAQAPSSWARINVMGHDSFAGVVTRIPGGYRIVYLDDSRYDADAPVERTRDIYAIHSIEWMTEMEHSKHVAAVHAGAAERVKQRLRSTTMPEGYKLMVVASSPVYGSLAFLRLSDGKARGYFRTTEDARHGAWQCADASRCVDGGGEYDEFGDEAWPTDPDLVEFVETSE